MRASAPPAPHRPVVLAGRGGVATDLPRALASLRAAHPDVDLRYARPADVALPARMLLSHLQSFV